MHRLRRVLVSAALAMPLLAACGSSRGTGPVIDVPEQYATVSEAVAEAPDGSTIRVASGAYHEEIVVERPLRIIGDGDDVQIVSSAGETVITISETRDVTIRGLTIVGGETGMSVMASSDVVIEGNVVVGSRYRAIDVVYASAEIRDNTVLPAPGPYVIGIRVANASSWPRSVVSGNTVEGAGAVGIAVNFATTSVAGNVVTGGEQAGVAINEMSTADVFDNVISAPRFGILVTDMSHATVGNNEVTGAAEPLKLQYHAEVELVDGR